MEDLAKMINDTLQRSDISVSAKKEAIKVVIENLRKQGKEDIAIVVEVKFKDYQWPTSSSEVFPSIEFSNYEKTAVSGQIPKWAKGLTEEEYWTELKVTNTLSKILDDQTVLKDLRRELSHILFAGDNASSKDGEMPAYTVSFNPDEDDDFERGNGVCVTVECEDIKNKDKSYFDKFVSKMVDGKVVTTKQEMIGVKVATEQGKKDEKDYFLNGYVEYEGTELRKVERVNDDDSIDDFTHHHYTGAQLAAVEELGIIDTESDVYKCAIVGSYEYSLAYQEDPIEGSDYHSRFSVSVGKDIDRKNFEICVGATIGNNSAYLHYDGENVTVNAVEWVRRRADACERQEEIPYSDFLSAVGETKFGKKFNDLVERLKAAGKNVTIKNGDTK